MKIKSLLLILIIVIPQMGSQIYHLDFIDADLTKEPVDIIITDASIYILDETNTRVDTIAIKNGKIYDYGESGAIFYKYSAETVFNMEGKTILPGFVDAHTHIFANLHLYGIAYLEAQEFAFKYGVTTVAEKFVYPSMITDLQALEQSGQLKIRINLFPIYNEAYLSINNRETVIREYWYPNNDPITNQSNKVRVIGVKIFVDGANSVDRGAYAVTIPYIEQLIDLYPNIFVNEYGDLYLTEDELTAIISDIQDLGYRVSMHIAGDRALDAGLNAINRVTGGDNTPFRHQIEHNVFLREDHYKKIQNINTLHSLRACYNTPNQHEHENYFPDTYDQTVNKYGLPSMGVKTYYESDANMLTNPEEPSNTQSIDPFKNLWCYVTRKMMDEAGNIHTPEPWVTKYKIGLFEALRIMTSGSAYALSMENHIGTLELGKFADLIVIDESPFEIPIDKLLELNIRMTMVGGEIVYLDPTFEFEGFK